MLHSRPTYPIYPLRGALRPEKTIMLKSQTLTIELSEKRERANILLEKTELSAEERSELDSLSKRLIEIEPEIRAAMAVENVTETTDAGENAELRALSDNASMGRILQATVEHRATSGLKKRYRIISSWTEIRSP